MHSSATAPMLRHTFIRRILLAIALLLQISSAYASPSPTVTNEIILLSDVPNAMRITGTYLQNASTVALRASGPSGQLYACAPGPGGFNVTTQPCMVQRPRVPDACLALQAMIDVYHVPGESCDTLTNATCSDGDNPGQPCPPLGAANNICVYTRCMMRQGSGSPPLECYSVTDVSLVGYSCDDQGLFYCDAALACVDARADSCVSELACALPPLAAGTYTIVIDGAPVANATVSIVQIPYVRTVVTDSGWYATNTSGSPTLYLSLDTPVMVDIWPRGLPLGNMSLALAAPGLLTYTFGYTDFPAAGLFSAHFAGPIVVVPVPELYSLCPAVVLAGINATVVVQGAGFYHSAQLTCIFGGAWVPVVFVSANVVHCIVFPATNGTANIPLRVSNDAGTFSATELFVFVTGVCEVIKPNSVPVGDACVCLPGFQDIDGTACSPCPDATYQPLAGQQTCIPCDSSEDTNGTVGNTQRTACICRDGRYRAAPADQSCALCGAGMLCERGQIEMAQGYWRYAPSDLYAVACPYQPACAGGAGLGNALCAPGYAGPLCLNCASSYARLGDKCLPCASSAANTLIVVLIVLLGAGAVLLMGHASTTDRRASNMSWRSDEDKPAVTMQDLGMVGKIVFSYLQILYYVGQIKANWSPDSRSFFVLFVPLSMSSTFLSFQCAFRFDFYTRMTLVMLEPAIVAAVLGIVILLINHAVRLRNGLRTHGGAVYNHYTWLDYVRLLLIALYMTCPAVALDILQSLSCMPVRGTGHSFLVSDMAVNCDSRGYRTYVVVASLYLVVVIAAPCAYMVYALHARAHTIALTVDTQSVRSAGNTDPACVYVYFTQGFCTSPHKIAWEFVILARKIAIVALAALLPAELAILWALTLVLICISMTQAVMPYQYHVSWYLDGNKLDTLGLVAIAVTLILAFHSLAVGDAARGAVFALLVLVNCSTLLFFLCVMYTRALRHAGWLVAKFARSPLSAGGSRSRTEIAMHDRTGAVSTEVL
jgi:hypothetical protein